MNVLLAIDHSPCSEAAVEAVLTQFQPDKTTVRVVHVVEWPGMLAPALTFAQSPRAADCVLAAHDDIRRRGHELVARAASRLLEARFKATAFVVEAEVRHAILAMAAAWPADTIVIGSHGRHALDRFLLGSVSEHVLRHAACAVHVVRQRPTPLRDQQLLAAS